MGRVCAKGDKVPKIETIGDGALEEPLCEFCIFTDSEGRAFETCAEYLLQKGFWKLCGRLPSLMLGNDQEFFLD